MSIAPLPESKWIQVAQEIPDLRAILTGLASPWTMQTIVGKWMVSTIQPIGLIQLGRQFETMVFSVDENGIVTSWVEKYAQFYDAKPEAIAGHHAVCLLAAANHIGSWPETIEG